MSTIIRAARRFIPIEQVAFLEEYTPPPGDLPIRSTKEFKSRIVYTDRASVLAVEALEDLANVHGFRLVADDLIATNPQVAFQVEEFESTPGFTPDKAYRSRLTWQHEGARHSKLMLTDPETLLAVVVRGEANQEERESATKPMPRRPRATNPRRRNRTATRNLG